MDKYGIQDGEKNRLKLDISGQTDCNEVYALFDDIRSDDEEDIANLLEDSDTEFDALID